MDGFATGRIFYCFPSMFERICRGVSQTKPKPTKHTLFCQKPLNVRSLLHVPAILVPYQGTWSKKSCVGGYNTPDFVFRRNGRVHLNRRGASVQSTTGSRGVCISGSNAGYTMFRGSVKSTGYQIQSPLSPSLPLPCVTVCHHISTGLYPCFSSGIHNKWTRNLSIHNLCGNCQCQELVH